MSGSKLFQKVYGRSLCYNFRLYIFLAYSLYGRSEYVSSGFPIKRSISALRVFQRDARSGTDLSPTPDNTEQSVPFFLASRTALAIREEVELQLTLEKNTRLRTARQAAPNTMKPSSKQCKRSSKLDNFGLSGGSTSTPSLGRC